jgi:Domain of unknown function (DUF4129)
MLWNVPIDIGRDEAAAAARTELAKSVYQQGQPSIVVRFAEWLVDRLETIFGALGLSPGIGFFLLVLLIASIVAVVVWRIGPLRATTAARSQPVFHERSRSADDYRALAEAAAARGNWDDAVRERFRAIVRSLEERDILDERAGRTADEAAVEAARALPDAVRDLIGAARTFDDVTYGDAHVDAVIYATLAALDGRLAHSRPFLSPDLVR